MRILFAVIRTVVAAAIISAIVAQLLASTAFWHSRGIADITINVTNFFSFFTVESNALSVIMLLLGSWFLVVREGTDSRGFTVFRAAVVTYMVTTGIVYNLLLRGIELPQGSTVAWSNEVLHVVAPVYLLVDWLLAPGRQRLPQRAVLPILAFPLVWAIYTLIRGPLTPDEVFHRAYWYPYPFLNPNTSPEGYFSVAFYVILIAAIIGLVGAGVIWLTTRTQSAADSPPIGVGSKT